MTELTEGQRAYREEYLKSEHWQKKRKERLEIDKGECQMCGSKENLCVHHINYDRLGNELTDVDLITLCHDCHSWIHAIKWTYSPEVKKMAAAYRQEAQEAIKDIACKYRQIGGQHLAKIAYGFIGDEHNRRVPTILRLLRETLVYDAGYGSVFPSCGNVSTYTIAAKELKKMRTGERARVQDVINVFGRERVEISG